jgi:tetratricopeptide (TPR) repeat protein
MSSAPMKSTALLSKTLSTLAVLIALAGCGRLGGRSEADFLKKGRQLVSAKDYSRAILEFQNAAKTAPNDAEPLCELGSAWFDKGDFRQAAGYLRRCIALNPSHAGAKLKLAQLMTASNDPTVLQHNAADLKELLRLDPGNVNVTDTLALNEWRLGDREEAMERLQQVLKSLPESLSSSVLLARMKISQQDLAAAEDVLQNAARSAPQSSEAALALGEILILRGQTAKAEVEIRRAIELNARNAQALLALAAIQTTANRMDEAEQTYRRLSFLPEKTYKPLHALFLFSQGKRDQAVAEFRALAKAVPDDRAARTRLIAALWESGSGAEAEKLLADALRKNPKDVDALTQRGTHYLTSRKAADAERDLHEVLRFLPDNADAHRAMAAAFKAQGKLQSERAELIEALKLRRSLLPARLALARNYVMSNDPKSALQILNEASPAQQQSGALIIERNWALLASGDLAQLASVFSSSQDNGNRTIKLQKAIYFMEQKNYPAARSLAEDLLKTDAKDIRAARIVSESYIAEKQPAQAAARMAEFAKAAPDSASMQFAAGILQGNTRNFGGARQYFEAALRADGHFVSAELALADLDRRENKPDAARQRLAGLIQREPSNTNALLLLAETEGQAGNSAAAIDRYRAVLAIDPGNLGALNNLSVALTSGHEDEALGLAQRALELAPQNPAVQDTLGWIYYRKGIYATATQYLRAAVAAEPNPKRQYHLALAYLKQGELQKGQALLESALRQDPSLKMAVRD